ncbi:MAG: hypothetical protein HY301_19560 [Verrucomicrobia bacterium]|nr:hypothetical protein [Verrucomicrobiota bacterium]
MKTILITLAAALAFTVAAQAESKVTLSGVHLCCKSCVTGVAKAVAKSPGVTATCDAKAGTVELTAADAATVQKGVNAIVAAGYFGSSSDAAVKVSSHNGAKDGKVASLAVNGVHLCCGKCVTAVDKAVTSVAGVKGHNAEKGAKSFTVTGDFNAKELFAALEKAGLTGKAGK